MFKNLILGTIIAAGIFFAGGSRSHALAACQSTNLGCDTLVCVQIPAYYSGPFSKGFQVVYIEECYGI